MLRTQGPNLAASKHALPSDGLWADDAISAPLCEVLRGPRRADTAVIGGGVTGLSTALHLAERGASVVLLEADEIGWGASGRAAGQVLPWLKPEPIAIEQRFGVEQGRRLIEWAGAAPSIVFDLIARFGIDCAPTRAGAILAAVGDAGRSQVERRARQLEARHAPVELVEGAPLAETIGSGFYAAGLVDPRGGSVQPLSYVRGLAHAALAAGAVLHTHSPVVAMTRQAGAWRLETTSGEVTCESVVIATNAHTDDLVDGVRRSVLPVRAAQAASTPLPPELRRLILPRRHVVFDTRTSLVSFRISPDGRLVMGGPGGAAGSERGDPRRVAARAAREVFGDLGLTWERAWSGLVALTPDGLPRLHEPAPGVFAGLGFNGRGIAAGTAMGLLLTRLASGGARDEIPLPVTAPRPIPAIAHKAAVAAMPAASFAGRMLDRSRLALARRPRRTRADRDRLPEPRQ